MAIGEVNAARYDFALSFASRKRAQTPIAALLDDSVACVLRFGAMVGKSILLALLLSDTVT